MKNFEENLFYLERNNISICGSELIDIFNQFLKYTHNSYRFNELGKCNGLSAYFCRHAQHGKLDKWLNDMSIVVLTTPDLFAIYDIKTLFYKTMFNILVFQEGAFSDVSKEYKQLHMQNINIISAVDIMTFSEIKQKDIFRNKKLLKLFLDQNNNRFSIRLQEEKHLNNPKKTTIEFNFIPNSSLYEVIINPLKIRYSFSS